MSQASTLEQQQRIVGPDGTTLYIGDGLVSNPFVASSSEASAVMTASEAAIFDTTNGILPRTESVAAGVAVPADIPQSMVLKVLRIVGVTSVGFIGIARSNIAAGKAGPFAGIGSILCVKSTTVALTVGVTVTGSATAGQVAVDATPLTGETVGQVIKTNTVAAPGTGSTSQAGIIFNPR